MADSTQVHMIRRQLMDLHFADETLAKDLQDQFGRIYSQELLPIIESVLEEFSSPDQVIRFDKLEVDLGEIDPERIIQELKQKLLIALRQCLASQIRNIAQPLKKLDAQTPHRLPIVQAKIDLLFHFLIYGYLSPWARGKEIDLKNLLSELIDSQAPTITNAFRTLKDKPQSFERLVKQFSTDQQHQLQKILAPTYASFFQAVLNISEKEFHQFPQMILSTSEFREQYSITLFQYLSSQPESSITQEKWIIQLHQSMLKKVDTSSFQALNRSMASIIRKSMSTISKSDLEHLNSTLSQNTQQYLSNNRVKPQKEEIQQDTALPQKQDLTQVISYKESSIFSELTSIQLWENDSLLQGTAKPSMQAYVDVFIHYMIEGYWSWWTPLSIAEQEFPPAISVFMEERKPNEHKQFVTLLSEELNQNQAKIEKVSRWVAKGLTSQTHLALFGEMMPDLSGFLFLFQQFLAQNLSDSPIILESFWTGAWSYVFQSPTQIYQLTSLVQEMIPALAQTQQQSPESFIQEITSILAQKINIAETRWLPIHTVFLSLSTAKIERKTSLQDSSKVPQENALQPSQKDKIKGKKELKETIKLEEAEKEEQTGKELEEIRKFEEVEKEEQTEKELEQKEKQEHEKKESEIREDLLEIESENIRSKEEIEDIVQARQDKEKRNEGMNPIGLDEVRDHQKAVRIDEAEKGKEKHSDQSSLPKKIETEETPPISSISSPSFKEEPGIESEKDQRQQVLELLSYFMRHGSIPINSSVSTKAEFKQQLSQLAKVAPRQMGHLVGELILTPQIRLRLIKEVSDELFEELIQVLPEVREADILQYYKGLAALNLREVFPLPVIKQELIHYLIGKKGRTPVPYEYLNRLLKRAQKIGMDVKQAVIPKLQTEITSTKTSSQKELQQLIEALEIEWKERAIPNKLEERKQTIRRPLGDMPIDISNAGLVLVWPFIPHYFKTLGFLTAKRTFKEEAFAKRGVHLLQYIVRKSVEDSEEQLALNKLLCGLSLATPIDPTIEMTEQESGMAESMLNAVCQQWTAMKNASPDGIRGSFLIREGKLEKKLKNWELFVEKKPFDMLLDRLPWSISMVKFPWMDSILQVNWR